MWPTDEQLRMAEMQAKDATIARLRAALLEIRNMTDADNEESYRVDDRDGCLDTVHHTAKMALEASK